MSSLTGLYGLDWLIVFFYAFGAVLVAMSRRGTTQGLRLGGFLVVPLVCGVTVLVVATLLFAGDVRRFLPFLAQPVTVFFAVGVVFVAAAVVDMLFVRFVPLVGRLRGNPSSVGLADVGMLLFVGGAAAVVLAGMVGIRDQVAVIQEGRGLGTTFTVEATHSLPGAPMGVAMRGDRDGYLSLGEGEIAHFELQDSPGGSLELTTVAEGLSYPRGLAVSGDVLVVGELGPLPCPDAFPYCKGDRVPVDDPVEGERRILEESRGRLLAYDIAPDGSLSGERTLLGDLPVANTEHGINGLATGPDGDVYVAIGHVDNMPADVAAEVERPHADLVGTVLRVAPDGSGFEVFARGLRNVYGLAFDDSGGLWGVDNDGETVNGWRAEEVLRIREGAHYGYPDDGTFGRPESRDDWPVWVIDTVGSAGIGWAGHAGVGPGLLMGSCGRLDALRLTDFGGEWKVDSRADHAVVLELPGCVTDIEPVAGDRIAVSIFRSDALYLIRPQT